MRTASGPEQSLSARAGGAARARGRATAHRGRRDAPPALARAAAQGRSRCRREEGMKAAIYARMSTDKQSETSPEDQIARCREFAQSRGWIVVGDLVVAEAGISGASRHNRPGLLGLIARIDEWEVLVAYDFARLARNEEDMGWMRNRLRSRRRIAIEASTGLDLDNVGARVMGVMSAEYLEKVRQDTHRGLRGRFDRKLATGCAPFGYRTTPIVTGQDAHGHPITSGYRLEVDPQVSPIVVRIFEGYARQGLGLRTLAHHLNAEGIAPPRPRGSKGRAPSWAPTAIREMLRNPIYRGERVWNRSEWRKDHETGRRSRFPRPEAEWVRQQDEAWRIVSDELWHAAQDARDRRNERHDRDAAGRILRTTIGNSSGRKRLLSGFLECGECGGSYHELSSCLWGCSWRKNRGAGVCSNDLKLPTALLESTGLAAVRNSLDDDIAAQALEVAVQDLRRRVATADPRRLEEELAALDAKIGRALDLAIDGGGDLPAVKERLRALRADRERVAGELARAGTVLPTVEELLPRLREKLHAIEKTLRADVKLARLALGALLAEERLRIYRDGRIEGLAVLAPETLAAPKRRPGAASLGGSGGALPLRGYGAGLRAAVGGMTGR